MESQNVLKICNVTKEYPGVKALNNVSFEARGGEVLGLIGVNGAGKSTLMNILGGITSATEGSILLNDQVLEIHTPMDSEHYGIGFIHQEPILFDHMTVAENICMTQLGRLVNYKEIHRIASSYLESLGADIDPKATVGDLAIGRKQLVAIARAISEGGKVLLFDEPTSSFTEDEKKSLFNVIATLKKQGSIIFYISHFLEEIEEICDRIVVLRDGQKVMEGSMCHVNREDILRNMISGEIARNDTESYEKGNTVLKVDKLCEKGILQDISFELKAGEIVGIWGLMGSGRTELLRAVYGLDKVSSGEIQVANRSGKLVKMKGKRIKRHLGFLTENRHEDGVLLSWSIWENMTAPNLEQFLKGKIVLNRKKQIVASEKYAERVTVKAPSVQTSVAQLSGGNQQKVIIAKWLMRNPKVFLMDEPTRGVDVGAKAEIQKLLRRFAKDGAAILVVSSELEEISGLSDRIFVMNRGRFVAELQRDEISKDKIMSYCV